MALLSDLDNAFNLDNSEEDCVDIKPKNLLLNVVSLF